MRTEKTSTQTALNCSPVKRTREAEDIAMGGYICEWDWHHPCLHPFLEAGAAESVVALRDRDGALESHARVAEHAKAVLGDCGNRLRGSGCQQNVKVSVTETFKKARPGLCSGKANHLLPHLIKAGGERRAN